MQINHEQTLWRSVQIARASQMLMPHWRFFSPFNVMRVLSRAKIRFALIGSFGLCGWRNQARAAGYTEVLVGRSVWKRAIGALQRVWPKLDQRDSPGAVELRHPRTGSVAAKVVKPIHQPYCEVMTNVESVAGKRIDYRIPDLEMALTLTFADMTGKDRCWADRYLAAHDFICIVKANEAIDEIKLLRLGSLISPKDGKGLISRMKTVRRGGKLII